MDEKEEIEKLYKEYSDIFPKGIFGPKYPCGIRTDNGEL